jgi:hypothetical protein
MAKRANTEEVEKRLASLREWNKELESNGERLTIPMIQDRLGLSRAQAGRYRRRVFGINSEQDMGKALVQNFVSTIPTITAILREDLGLLNEMAGDSERENLTLIKARRDQALAIARLEIQILKELKDLGVMSKDPTDRIDQDQSETDQDSNSESREFKAEILKQAERELREFELELTSESPK